MDTLEPTEHSPAQSSASSKAKEGNPSNSMQNAMEIEGKESAIYTLPCFK